MKRRGFISLAVLPTAAFPTATKGKTLGSVPVQTTQRTRAGYFTPGKCGERWMWLTADRKPFFSVGLNHIDSSPLRYSKTWSGVNSVRKPYRQVDPQIGRTQPGAVGIEYRWLGPGSEHP
jgi:hypothetical protein